MAFSCRVVFLTAVGTSFSVRGWFGYGCEILKGSVVGYACAQGGIDSGAEPVECLDVTESGDFFVSQQAALQAAGGHYGYGSYQNVQLPASSAPRAPSVGNMYMPSNYNL